MKTKILKLGFGYIVLTIIVITISLLFNNGIDKQLQDITPVQDQEVPLQYVVEEKVEGNKETKENNKKKTTTKKTQNKINNKKTTNKKVTKVSGSKAQMQQYAHHLVLSYGWTEYDYQCLVKIVNHESSWNPNVVNKSSGACGLAQALPCSKMSSVGSDYRTNYKTQLKWMMKYIKERYKTPSKAWTFWQNHHWY